MTLKKIIAALCCCVLLAGVVAVLPGCGPSDEELIRQAVTAKYDKYKDAEDEALSGIISALENESLTKLGIDNEAFATAVVDGFDYAIDDITVDGNTAVVTVTFAGKSYQDYFAMVSDITATLADDPTFATMSQEEKYDAAGQKLMADLNSLPIKDETVNLDYELVDNNWQEADEQAGLRSINNILFLKP